MRSAAWPDTYRLTTTQGNLVIAIKDDLDNYHNNIGCP